MAHPDLSTANFSVGIHAVPQYIASVEPIFFPLLLFCLFILFAVGSFLIQKEATGRSNLFSSLATGAYLVTVISFVMNMIPGLLNPLVPVICIVISMAFTLLLFATKKKSI